MKARKAGFREGAGGGPRPCTSAEPEGVPEDLGAASDVAHSGGEPALALWRRGASRRRGAVVRDRSRIGPRAAAPPASRHLVLDVPGLEGARVPDRVDAEAAPRRRA